MVLSLREMGARPVRYAAPGWGVGELWTHGEAVVWHEHPVAGSPPDGFPAPELVERLLAYFGGEAVSFEDVELDLDGLPPFHRQLAEALRGVPRGEVVTYGELAALAGRPGAHRAAGTFCSRNHLAIFIPCHRVVAADGIGPYGVLGVEYKRRLLALEGCRGL
jgi:methylated-DNA-[protein]-cysteine S-methyltransferase